MKKTLTILLIVLSFNQVFSQVPSSYSFSELVNFSPKVIFDIFEDDDRNIWFGTNQGLYKWDGCHFNTFQNFNYTTSYSSIQQDSSGRIWCLNFTGQLFYVENDSLALFSNEKELVNSIFDYKIDYFPAIYLTSNYGLIEYDFTTKKREIHSANYKSSNYKINPKGDTLFYEFIEGLAAYKKGLLYFSNGKLQYKEEKNIPESLLDVNKKIFTYTPFILPIKNDILLIGNLNKQIKISRLVGDTLINFFSPIETVNNSSIYYDDSKQIFFIGTRNGTYVYDKSFHPLFEKPILEGLNISKIIQDREGNYWVSTLNDGIHIIPSLDFLVFENKKIQNSQIKCILKDNKNTPYLIDEFGTIYKIDNDRNLYLIGNFNEHVENVFYNPYTNEIAPGNLNVSFNLNTNTIVPSTYDYNFDTKSVSFLSESVLISSGSGSSNLRLFSDKEINLSSIFSDSINFISDKNSKNVFHKIRSKRSTYNAIDFKNNLAYIYYTDGLFYYKKGRSKEITLNDNSIFITAMSQEKDGILWVSTTTQMLLKLENGIIVDEIKITEKAQKIIQWNSFLFISTPKGLLKLNTDTKHKYWINNLDGLPSNNISDLLIINDTLLIATKKGVVKLSCEYNFVNTTKPLISINKVAIWEKDTILQKNYELNHLQNNLTISFSCNSTRSQNNYTYQYRMLGIDSLWITQNSSNNIARFPSLPNGNFIFQLKALNEDGTESEVSEISFFIDLPYYKKWWFYVLMTFIIIVFVSLIFVIRIKIIKQQNNLINDKKEIEKQLSQSQLTALRSQMNPHFIFNALNSIQDYIISNNKELASDYLGLFADLMRKYLHFSNEEEITLEEEIETLDMYLQLEKVRFEETLSYTIIADKSLDLSTVNIPVMLIQPFAENAVKHGLLHKKGSQTLDILFEQEGQNLVISIKDNGIGRKQATQINKMRKKKHKSFATSAQQKRIDLINQNSDYNISIVYTDLEELDSSSTGTMVIIKIPLN